MDKMQLDSCFNQSLCADIVSVVAMALTNTTEMLHYHLFSSSEDIDPWGHEYIIHLSAEIASELKKVDPTQKLSVLAKRIITLLIKHNAVHEMCHLLMEIEESGLIHRVIDKHIYERVCICLKRYV
ncbi:unnamed protein product, partial [Didymodactylos carnosus]